MKYFLRISLVIQTIFIGVLLFLVIDLTIAEKPTPLTENLKTNDSNFYLENQIIDLKVEEKVIPANPYSYIEALQKIDNNLKVVNFYDDAFKDSELSKNLSLYPQIKVYILLEFSQDIDYQILYKLERLGFSKIFKLKDEKYLDKKIGIFYTSFSKLKNSFRYSKIVNGFILENYTAKGLYKLGIKANEPNDEITFRISAPFSHRGKEALNIFSRFTEEARTINKEVNENNGVITTAISPQEKITFLSEIEYLVSLSETLNHSIYLKGENIHLQEYQSIMQEKNATLYEVFTRYSEKVVPSNYINNIIKEIDKSQDLAGIWKQITRILNKDIRYDWKKRDLFFNGNLTYNNIKDMYMTAEELGEKKIGACPERTSLEIALLRELGIAARSSTRLYHIFTEIYLPEEGWITTSSTLNAIPLCQSHNESMAYFIDWSPDHPIRLKWEGYLYPSIVIDYFNSSFSKRLALK